MPIKIDPGQILAATSEINTKSKNLLSLSEETAKVYDAINAESEGSFITQGDEFRRISHQGYEKFINRALNLVSKVGNTVDNAQATDTTFAGKLA